MNGNALAGMGAEIVDLDGDGLPDIFFTAFSRANTTRSTATSESCFLKTARSKPDYHRA